MDWTLWFLRLSGWPVFLSIVTIVVLGMVALSVILTRLSNRSAVYNAGIAVVTLTALTLLGLGMGMSRALLKLSGGSVDDSYATLSTFATNPSC